MMMKMSQGEREKDLMKNLSFVDKTGVDGMKIGTIFMSSSPLCHITKSVKFCFLTYYY